LSVVHHLVEAGLGLDYADLRLEATSEEWIAAGATLRSQVAELLVDSASAG